MYISDIIKEIAEANNLGFYHGPKDYQNVQDQKTDVVFPVCYLSMPVRAKGTKTKQGFSEPEFNLEILFADKTQFEWDTDQIMDVIRPMDDISHKFVNQLLHHEGIKDVLAYDTLEVINIFDVNLSGIIMNVTVKPVDLRANCP